MSPVKPMAICLLIFTVTFLVRADEVNKANVQKALRELETAVQKDQPPGPSADLQKSAQSLLHDLQVSDNDSESPELRKRVDDLYEQTKKIRNPGPLVTAIQDLKNALDSSAPGISPVQNSNTTPVTPSDPVSQTKLATTDERSVSQTIFDFLAPFLMPAVILLTLALLSYIAITLTTQRQFIIDSVGAVMIKGFQRVMTEHEGLTKQQNSFKKTQEDTIEQIADLRNELKLIRKAVNSPQYSDGGYESFQQRNAAQINVATTEDRPAFPTAADDYLKRMAGRSLVVKRDFQNDMLVGDPEGKGELVLVRDPRIPDEVQTLLLVPRVTQLQMSQDYHNYYERYFECANPESGAVWILAPAVADKVSGGWLLREKGRLEIR